MGESFDFLSGAPHGGFTCEVFDFSRLSLPLGISIRTPIDSLVPSVLLLGMNLERHSSAARPRKPTPSRRHACRAFSPAQIQPFLQFVRPNRSRINTSKNISIFCISFIGNHLKSTRINTSGNKDLKSPRINTSGHKDLKSFRINTSKKGGRGVGGQRISLSKSPTTRDLGWVDHNRTGWHASDASASSQTTKSRRIDSY
jgi:hypothetical protein